MRPHNHTVRHTARARAAVLAHPRHDTLLGGAGLALGLATVFAVLGAGWQLGGVVLHMLSLVP